MTTETLGKRVARLRLALDLTQEDLARKIDLPLKTVASIEQEVHTNISRNVMRALADGLGVSMDELDGKPAKPARKA